MQQEEADRWYSDAALEKQRQLAELTEKGEQAPLTLLLGLFEPRVPPAADELCCKCGSDARDMAGGGTYEGKLYCTLCMSLERYLP